MFENGQEFYVTIKRIKIHIEPFKGLLKYNIFYKYIHIGNKLITQISI